MKSIWSLLLCLFVVSSAQAQTQPPMPPTPDPVGDGDGVGDVRTSYCKSLLDKMTKLTRTTIPAQEEVVRLAWEKLQPLEEAEDAAFSAYWDACFDPMATYERIEYFKRAWFVAVCNASAPRAEHEKALAELKKLRKKWDYLNEVFFRFGCHQGN